MSDLYGPPLAFRVVNRHTGAVVEERCSMSVAAFRAGDSDNVVLQFTGVNDEGDTEICGGDVVMYGGVPFAVRYDGAEASFYLLGLDRKQALDALDFWHCDIDANAPFTIIGNRFEPREALEARAREVLEGCLSCGANPMSDNCKASACDAELERFGL